MSIVRAWKNPEYRRSVGGGAAGHPAGDVDLSADMLDQVAGGTPTPVFTTTTITTTTATPCTQSGTHCE